MPHGRFRFAALFATIFGGSLTDSHGSPPEGTCRRPAAFARGMGRDVTRDKVIKRHRVVQVNDAVFELLFHDSCGLSRDSRPDDKARILRALPRLVAYETGNVAGQLLERNILNAPREV